MLPRPHAITREIEYVNVFKWVPPDATPVLSGGAECASTNVEAVGASVNDADCKYRKPCLRALIMQCRNVLGLSFFLQHNSSAYS